MAFNTFTDKSPPWSLTALDQNFALLGNVADATAGSSLLGYKSSATGAVGRLLSAKLADVVSVKDFGAIGDGVADDTAAFAAALLASRNVYAPIGIYKTTSTVTVPINTRLFGAGTGGGGMTVIKPSAAVTVAIEFLGTSSRLEHIYLDGVNTTNAVGIRVGNDTLTDEAVMLDVQVWRFTGATGVGMRIVNMVRMGSYDLYIAGNGTNLDIGSTSAGTFPDSLHFYNCVFHSSTVGPGVSVSAGFEISFIDCTSEANFQAGYSVIPPVGGQVFNIRWIGGWMEANWQGTASGGARHAKYHLDADGTAAGAALNNLLLDGTFFNSSANEASSIHLNKVFNIRLMQPLTAQLAGQIVVDNASSSGWLDKYQAFTTSFTDNSGNIIVVDNLYQAWTPWVPTYSSSVGDAAASFNGAVTTNTARYKIDGKRLTVALSFSGTLKAVTPTSINASFPAGTAQNNNQYMPAQILNNATFETGQVRLAVSTFVFGRANFVAWTASVNFECDIVYTCELA